MQNVPLRNRLNEGVLYLIFELMLSIDLEPQNTNNTIEHDHQFNSKN